MLSVRIERHMLGDSDEDCNHADFFFSDGYMATWWFWFWINGNIAN